MTNVVSFVKKNIKGFHYCYKMELDDLDNKFTKVQYQMVFTLILHEGYWLVKRRYLQDFELDFGKGHLVMYITLDLQMKACKSKNNWYQSKDKQIEWHLKWFYLYSARLDSIAARISDEEIKMAKTRN
jgi:hypothetical protein